MQRDKGVFKSNENKYQKLIYYLFETLNIITLEYNYVYNIYSANNIVMLQAIFFNNKML